MHSQASEALDVSKRFIAALTDRDGEALCALLHDDVVCEAPFPVTKGENKPGCRICTGESVHAQMRNMKNIVAKADFINQVWRTTDDGLAMLEADGDMLYPNGRPYLNKYLMLFRVSDGKIAWWAEYYSPVITARSHDNPLNDLP